MDKKEFINRRDAIKEDFRVRVDKEGDALSVEAEGEDSQEFFDFARCLFGDNFDSFNCDFNDPVQPEQQVEAEIPEVGFDYKAEDQIADVEDPFTVFDEPIEEVHVGETTEEPKEEEPAAVEETEVEDHKEETEVEDHEEEAEDHKYENQPMDMINGKLVPAKDPTASEVEIEGEEELEEDLKEREYDCYYKDEYVGSVYAKSQEEAYEKMEKEWPELHYGEYDGVAIVLPAEESDDYFVNAFSRAFYGRKKDLSKALSKAKTVKKEELKADAAQASEEVSLKEDYVPESEEEKALWDKLADNGCGPNFEYELLYDATEFDNRVTRSFEKVTYDGDFVPSDSYLVGYYNDEVFYYKTPTHKDVLEFLGEDHLTAEGAERFIADSKKKAPEFVNFLNDKYVEEAADKFQDDLEDGKYDEFISNWDEEWPEPDYDDYDD